MTLSLKSRFARRIKNIVLRLTKLSRMRDCERVKNCRTKLLQKLVLYAGALAILTLKDEKLNEESFLDLFLDSVDMGKRYAN